MDKKKENKIIKRMKKASSRFELVHILENVEQTQRICEEAIRINPYYLEYIKEQTPELCLLAFQGELPYYWGHTPLRHVKEQTPEICLAAIIQEARAISDVKVQTEELCIEAVSRNGLVLESIEKQTFKICKEAVLNEEYALNYVRDQTMRRELKKVIKPHLNTLVLKASAKQQNERSDVRKSGYTELMK